MVKWNFIALFLGSIILAPVAAVADCDCSSLREVFGEYATVEVTRYRGGLTPREEALQRIEKSTQISERKFSLWGEFHYDAPHYEVICHPVSQEEGEVRAPSERWGDFYGFGMGRDVIEVLHVIPLKQEGPRYILEIVDDELWAFFDGWFYRMERAVHD